MSKSVSIDAGPPALAGHHEVIVVGAGFAGLTAAERLVEQGVRVLVLEARDRVGGRTKPGRVAGQVVDLGGMWTGPGQPRLRALGERFGLTLYPTHLAGRNIIELGERVGSAEGEDYADAMGMLEKLDFARLVMKLDRLVESISPQAPWSDAQAESLDRLTVDGWLRQHCHTQGCLRFCQAICRAVMCAEPAQLSMLFFAFYLASGGGLMASVTAEGGAQQDMFAGGLHQIAVGMERALGDRVVLESPVTGIDHGGSLVRVSTPTGHYTAERVIVAMSPALCGRIPFTPMLPHLRDGLHQRMPMGSVIKVWVAYPAPFWREQGYNGLVSSDGAAFSPYLDVTPPGAPVGLLAGFFGAGHAAAWSARGPIERRAEVVRELVLRFGLQAAQPIDYVDNDWTQEAWSCGCYGGVAGPGVLSVYGPALREPVGRLHWAGAETATVCAGYVEGAIQSGDRAAAEVLAALRSPVARASAGG